MNPDLDDLLTRPDAAAEETGDSQIDFVFVGMAVFLLIFVFAAAQLPIRTARTQALRKAEAQLAVARQTRAQLASALTPPPVPVSTPPPTPAPPPPRTSILPPLLGRVVLVLDHSGSVFDAGMHHAVIQLAAGLLRTEPGIEFIRVLRFGSEVSVTLDWSRLESDADRDRAALQIEASFNDRAGGTDAVAEALRRAQSEPCDALPPTMIVHLGDGLWDQLPARLAHLRRDATPDLPTRLESLSAEVPIHLVLLQTDAQRRAYADSPELARTHLRLAVRTRGSLVVVPFNDCLPILPPGPPPHPIPEPAPETEPHPDSPYLW